LTVAFASVKSSVAQQGGTSPLKPTGLRIQGVAAGWPAHAAGIETGDTIIRIDGNAIVTENQFLDAVREALYASILT
jgi:S1-C subfamily serine protease